MISDVLTMLWKESREFLLQRGSATRGILLGIGLPTVVLGILLPFEWGPRWVADPGSLVMLGTMPLFLTISIVADSFAGERERHTLETLLATRLSDQAILIGKIATAVLYAWGIVILQLILSLITVNLTNSTGKLLLFPTGQVAALIVFSFLFALLASCAGVLVSLRASSVRSAMQTLSLSFMAIMFGALFAAQAMPREWQASLAQFLLRGDKLSAAATIAVMLIAVDATLFAAARARFRRARLILD